MSSAVRRTLLAYYARESRVPSSSSGRVNVGPPPRTYSPNLSSKISPNLLLRIGVRLLLGGPRAWLSDQRVRARFEDPIRVDNVSFLVLFLLAFAGYFIIVCLFVQEKASGFFL